MKKPVVNNKSGDQPVQFDQCLLLVTIPTTAVSEIPKFQQSPEKSGLSLTWSHNPKAVEQIRRVFHDN